MIELLRQALHEVAAAPWPYVAEVIQFVILAAVVRLVLRRTIGKTLAERRRKLAAAIDQANGAAARHADAERRAGAIVAEARAQAQRTIDAATSTGRDARREGLAEIEREAAGAVARAQQAIDAERARAVREASEQLIELVASVVRHFLEQAMPESERRALAQRLILEHLKGLTG